MNTTLSDVSFRCWSGDRIGDLYHNNFQTPLAQLMLQKAQINLLVFDPAQQVIQHLLQAGVPREDIVLAFHPPRLRRFTEFAAV